MRVLMAGLSASLVLFDGCAAPVRGRPFDNSSTDFNGAVLHRLQTQGDVESVADAVLSIMENRGAQLVRRRNTSRGLVLSFRAAAERLQGTRSKSFGTFVQSSSWFPAGTFSSETVTTADYLAYGSLYYVEIAPIEGGVALQAIGLPVIDGITACPAFVGRFRDCRPAPSKDEGSFAENVEDKVGIDVSGRIEAEVLSGVFAQLQRKRWQDQFREQSELSRARKSSPLSPSIDDAFHDASGGRSTSDNQPGEGR